MMVSFTAPLFALGLTALANDQAGWQRVENDRFYFKVPAFMEPMTDLNDEAVFQYGSVTAEGKKVKELYMIVIVETQEEVASYGVEFDAITYWNKSMELLGSGVDNMEILTKKPFVEYQMGIKLVRGNATAKLGKIGITYHLGVYESGYAFYQFLAWTLSDQYKEYKPVMETMITSFREK